MNKNKNSLPIVIWEALYPVLLYYALIIVIENILIYVFRWLDPEGIFGLASNFPLIQVIYSLVTIPFLFSLYCNDRNDSLGMFNYMSEHKPKLSKEKLLVVVLAMLTMLFLGFALNNILVMSPLPDISNGYKEASDALYSGGLVTELLSSALLIPILEELVFRGIVFARMRRRLPLWLSVLISAVLFAALHGNIVQFIYALILGIVLALMDEKVGHVYPSIFAHMAINCFALLKTELRLLPMTEDGSLLAWVLSAAAIVIGLILLVLFLRRRGEEACK